MKDFKTDYFNQLRSDGIISKDAKLEDLNNALATENGRKYVYGLFKNGGYDDSEGG